MKKRVIAIALVFMLTFSILTACGNTGTPDTPQTQDPAQDTPANGQDTSDSSSDTSAPQDDDLAPTDKLIYWIGAGDTDPGKPAAEMAIELYKEHYPNVDVQTHYMGGDLIQALQVMLQDTSSPDFPDIIAASQTHLGRYAMEGIIYFLDDALQTPSWDDPNVIWYDTFVKNLIDSMRYDGKHFMIPNCLYSMGFFYDKNMFNRLGVSVPSTWEDFQEIAEVFKENGIAPTGLEGTEDWLNSWYYIAYCQRYMDQDQFLKAVAGEISFFDDPGFLTAAKLVEEMWNDNWFQPGAAGSVYPASQIAFVQGNVATLFCGGWLPSELSLIMEGSDIDLDVFPIPILPNQKHSATELWGNGEAIFASAHNKFNAINLLKVLSSFHMAPYFEEIALLPSPLKGFDMLPELAGYMDLVSDAEIIFDNMANLSAYDEYRGLIFFPHSTRLIVGDMAAEPWLEELDKQTSDYWS